MIITDINVRKLSPSEGMKLTNGEVLADGEVYLGVGDSADNWYEITIKEAEKIIAEREKKGEEENL